MSDSGVSESDASSGDVQLTAHTVNTRIKEVFKKKKVNKYHDHAKQLMTM